MKKPAQCDSGPKKAPGTLGYGKRLVSQHKAEQKRKYITLEQQGQQKSGRAKRECTRERKRYINTIHTPQLEAGLTEEKIE